MLSPRESRERQTEKNRLRLRDCQRDIDRDRKINLKANAKLTIRRKHVCEGSSDNKVKAAGVVQCDMWLCWASAS